VALSGRVSPMHVFFGDAPQSWPLHRHGRDEVSSELMLLIDGDGHAWHRTDSSRGGGQCVRAVAIGANAIMHARFINPAGRTWLRVATRACEVSQAVRTIDELVGG
jgi:hypothetical protein